jgi:catechol 2,3-dioxygenase-like lactoylglutathione lyase family enzyme
VDLGAFSVSLAVADLAASTAFYERLGFVATGGDAERGWTIMRNHGTTVGLFHGMFDRNMLTFNPGLDGRSMSFLSEFTDVRDIQRELEAAGVALDDRTDPGTTGAGHLMLRDPDGNPILIDQFDIPDGGGSLAPDQPPQALEPLELGPFTYSLAVGDLDVALDFYATLGFELVHRAEPPGRWAALRNGDAVIGLHENVIEHNSLTFNPGLDETSRAPRTDAFTTVEEIETVLIGRGLSPDRSLVPTGARASAFVDPDGNAILVHQFP